MILAILVLAPIVVGLATFLTRFVDCTDPGMSAATESIRRRRERPWEVDAK